MLRVFINYIYLFLKQNQTLLINPEYCYANRQTNKQNKIVWQLLQITATEIFCKEFSAKTNPQRISQSFCFCLFAFVILFCSSTKIDLVYFFLSFTKIDAKSYCISMKIFFGLHLKLTKNATALRCFQTTPPKKNFFVPPPHKHSTLAPGQPLTV